MNDVREHRALARVRKPRVGDRSMVTAHGEDPSAPIGFPPLKWHHVLSIYQQTLTYPKALFHPAGKGRSLPVRCGTQWKQARTKQRAAQVQRHTGRQLGGQTKHASA
eukprot:5722138-Prymnesium_polylepis.1